MALFDLYEKDGAVFRKPASRRHGIVDEVQHTDGSWKPYTGDRLAPVSFGDHIGQKEFASVRAALKHAAE